MAASMDTATPYGRFIDLEGVKIYDESHGHGEPLLLLHVGSLTGDMWQPYRAGFSEHYRVVLIGDRDELVPVEDATELYRLLGNAELAVVPDADHGAFFSAKVATFQPLMLDFLRRHSGR